MRQRKVVLNNDRSMGAGCGLHPFLFSGKLGLECHSTEPRSDEESAVSPTFARKQIPRFARNDKAWVVGVVPTNLLHS